MMGICVQDDENCIPDMEDMGPVAPSSSAASRPVSHRHGRNAVGELSGTTAKQTKGSESQDTETQSQSWREVLGEPPSLGKSKVSHDAYTETLTWSSAVR